MWKRSLAKDPRQMEIKPAEREKASSMRHQIATWRDEGRRGDEEHETRDRGRRDLPRARYVTSRHVTPRHVTSRHVTSSHSRHITTSHHITSHHITSHHTTSHHITSHHITRAHIAQTQRAHNSFNGAHTHTSTQRTTQHTAPHIDTHRSVLSLFWLSAALSLKIVLTPCDIFPVLCHDLC